jgi:hypothetical protein
MAAPIIPILGALLPAVSGVIDRLFPDAEARAKAQAEMQAALIAQEAQLQQAVIGVIRDEAKSEHWLAASWRPIVMLVFTALVVARWLGWSAPGITEAEVLQLWSIVELGLGGYVIGRSVEKIVPQIAGAVAETRRK